MTAPHQINRDSNASFHTIQVLRFLAALMVVVTHASYAIIKSYDTSFPAIDLGDSGVSLFFGISGFVMVMSSQKLVEMGNGWRTFMVNRLIRIAPLYWLITTFKIIMVLVASSLFVASSEIDLGRIIKAYLFLPALNKENFYRPIVGVGWTLNLEMFFYVIFAACLFLRLPRVLTASAVLLGLVLLPIATSNLWPVMSFYTDTIMLSFIWGMVIAHLYLRGLTLSPALSGVMVLAGLIYLLFPSLFSANEAVSLLLNSLAVFGVLLGAVLLEPTIKRYMIAPFRFFGDASYSLYLIHTSVVPVLPLLMGKLGLFSPGLAMLGSVMLSLVAAAALFVFVENPMTQKLRSMVRKSEAVPVRHMTPAKQSSAS